MYRNKYTYIYHKLILKWILYILRFDNLLFIIFIKFYNTGVEVPKATWNLMQKLRLT